MEDKLNLNKMDAKDRMRYEALKERRAVYYSMVEGIADPSKYFTVLSIHYRLDGENLVLNNNDFSQNRLKQALAHWLITDLITINEEITRLETIYGKK